MPYSKDPMKYPAELMELLHLFASGKLKEARLPCESVSEANGRRVQLQSFFSAVERYAEELATARARNAYKAVTLEAKSGSRAKERVREEFSDVAALAQTWEDRAYAAASLIVRMEKTPPAVHISKRQVEGTFGAGLKNLLAQQHGAPPSAADGTDPDTMSDDDFMVWAQGREDLTFDQQMRLFRLAKLRGIVKTGDAHNG